jgi:hypothetical protein
VCATPFVNLTSQGSIMLNAWIDAIMAVIDTWSCDRTRGR